MNEIVCNIAVVFVVLGIGIELALWTYALVKGITALGKKETC